MYTEQWWILTEGNDDARLVHPADRITFLVGDMGDAPTRDATGGNDVIEIVDTFVDFFLGDARTASAIHGAKFWGGDDILTLTRMGGPYIVSGDISYSSGSGMIGGDDFIRGGNAGRAGSFVGDVVENTSTLVGGNDTIIGSRFNDAIFGDAKGAGGAPLQGGDDRLSGGDGDDRVFGEAGNGVMKSVTGGNDRLDGGAGNDLLLGQSGNDTLIGGLGDDTLNGGFEGRESGVNSAVFDTVQQAVTVDLQDGYAIGQGFDKLIDIQNVSGSVLGDSVSGSEVANLLNGLAGNDVLVGRAGNDTLIGGAGSDTLIGGEGDDIYVDPANDVVFERANEGYDTVKSSAGYVLNDNVERLVLMGSGDVDGTGNALDNRIDGNAGNNRVRGLDGNDVLRGGAGNDTLEGGHGQDTLFGGEGADVFSCWPDHSDDRIADFDISVDRFDLHGAQFSALLEAGGNTILTLATGSVTVVGVIGLSLSDWNGLMAS